MATRCNRCNRVLTNPDCIKAGYGKICYQKVVGTSMSAKNQEPGQPGESRYEATLFPENIVCKRDPSGRPLVNVPHRIVRHSPDGFEWGYGGSGPAELALNILALFVGEEKAYPLHQDFK